MLCIVAARLQNSLSYLHDPITGRQMLVNGTNRGSGNTDGVKMLDAKSIARLFLLLFSPVGKNIATILPYVMSNLSAHIPTRHFIQHAIVSMLELACMLCTSCRCYTGDCFVFVVIIIAVVVVVVVVFVTIFTMLLFVVVLRII